jgi:transaldolase
VAARARHAPDELQALKTRLKGLLESLESGELDARTGATMVQAARALLATIQAENEMTTIAAVDKRLARISELEKESRKWVG